EPDAHGADGDFRLFVKGDGWRRVEGDEVPDQLRPGTGEASVPDERRRGARAIDLESVRTRHAGGEADVVKDRSDRDVFEIQVDALELLDPGCDQPRAHRVIEEVGLVELRGVLDRRGNQRRTRYSCKQPRAKSLAAGLLLAGSRSDCRHVDVNRPG